MTTVAYHGHEVMSYGGYTDLATGRTLTCEPGGIYDIIPVSAPMPVPSDGRFTEVKNGEEENREEKKSGEITTSVTPDDGGKG